MPLRLSISAWIQRGTARNPTFYRPHTISPRRLDNKPSMKHNTSATRNPVAMPYTNTLATKKRFVALCFMPPCPFCHSALAWHRIVADPSSNHQDRALNKTPSVNKEKPTISGRFHYWLPATQVTTYGQWFGVSQSSLRCLLSSLCCAPPLG